MAGNEPKDAQQSTMQRIRSLPMGEALRLARSPDVQERIALERLHGKLAWEPLLRNPSLSIPEVLRIASVPMLPPGLLDIILHNPAWLSNEQVRRTLLGNRSLKASEVTRILRCVPKRELELMIKQTTWPHAVREAARRLLTR
jgi:hypothetical protein